MIYYFSGTGNTRWIAAQIAEAIGEPLLYIPDLIRQESYTFTLTAGERIGFCFPTHGWQPPRIVREFIRKLRFDSADATGRHYCWALTTCGDSTGETMTILNRELSAVGLRASGLFSVVMPESYVCLPFMHTDTAGTERRKIAHARQQTGSIIDTIRARRQDVVDLKRGAAPLLYSYVIGRYFNRRMITDRPFTVDADACIRCGKCSEVCPSDNIDGTPPRWLHNGRCTCCLACYHYCPVHAINYGTITRKRGQYHFLALVLALLLSLPAVAQALYVGSYNIRYQNNDDNKNGNSWTQRCPVVCDQLNFEHPDIFGAQEVLFPQLRDMLQRLDGYDYIGVGRDDGKQKGEYAAIFYDKQKLRLVDNGHFWLSPTPDKPSLGWDAACIRICTWGLFEDSTTGLRFYFYNLHMDHVGVTARREAAKLVVDRIRQMAGLTGLPVVLTGDFNVDQNDEIYTIFTQSGLLVDSHTQARLRFAENGTFNGYHPQQKTSSRIDHVFVSPQFSVERYGVLTNTYWADRQRLPSDHYPVFVRLQANTSHLTPHSSLFTSEVNPLIGTGGHGHVFLGANVPFGFVQLGPTNRKDGWDWCSGYHYSDSIIIGFSHLHLSGTGCADLGDIAFLPVLDPKQQEVKFSHQAEYVRPGYYSVMLNNGIRVELTATERTGLHRYTLPANAPVGYLRFDLEQGIGWDKVTECEARQESPTVISGYRYSHGWADHQQVYFIAEFSHPVEICNEEKNVKVLRFTGIDQPLLVRVGLSAVSVEGAKANLRAEQQGWDFRGTVAEADRKWEEQLQKIQITGGTPDERTIFYTAMYHTMTAPSVFCDVDGCYRGSDGEVHQGDYVNYTTFSLWDTYRAAHPLMTLIHPERQEDIAQTMLNIWREQGKLPVWHLMGCETNCMVGNPAIPVLADLVLKGLTTQRKEAFEAMKASAMLDERGLKLLKEYGYIPCDLFDDNETVGRGLEYALADWCVARVAKKLNNKADQKYFDQRAQSYRKYFDPKTGFMRGLDSKGRFSFSDASSPFNPFHSAPKNRDYTEGNAWQYTWLVPHDVHGLVSLFGNEQRFVSKLDSLFIVDGDLGEEAPPDISGLIGQYAHGNEPSHHVLYLYNYVGQPWKSAKLIRKTLHELYHNATDGLSGNEDVGQMSAWYILSAMGLYQVEPAGGKYVFGSPLFPEVTMQVGNGKTFTIRAHDVSDENLYIQSVRLNGKPYTRSYIMYNDIVRGGTLEFQMGPQPSNFGTNKKDRP